MSERLICFDLFYDNGFVGKIALPRAQATVGRSRGTDFRLMDVSVSRRHLKIQLLESGMLTIEDLASTNGTFLNNKRVMTAELKENDSITVGRCTLVFKAVDPDDFIETEQPLWRKVTGKITLPPLSKPYGSYVYLNRDTITEFDGIAYSITKDEQHSAEKKIGQTYLKEIPRLQVLTTDTPTLRDEVTKFAVSKNIFVGTAGTQKLSEDGQVILLQPKVKNKKVKIPWKAIEFTLIPSVLVILGILAGRYFLGGQIDLEFKKAERRWEERLTKAVDRYRFDSRLTRTAESPEPSTSLKNAAPLSDQDVWKKIDERPSLRNFLLFEILDEIITEKDVKWSFELALTNLSKMESVTSRLPSVKKMAVVLNSEASDIQVTGLLSQRMVFLAEQKAQVDAAMAYREYKTQISANLASVSSCAGVRKAPLPGNVVTAFTILKSGKIGSVFVNESQSTQERPLWDCIRSRLALGKFEPPPGGNDLSIVYTFKFAGPTKLQF